jgi:hypothetical protein
MVVALAGSASAQTQTAWADKLFWTDGAGRVGQQFQNNTSHDFGTVARGAQLKYRFHMKNIYKVPLEIASIRVSCGCVTWTQSTNSLQPNETGYIDINMDGRRFAGPKTVTIYVTVGPEYISTATLRVIANARQDVVFNPGQVNFGIVQHGQSPMEAIDVEYSGALDWRITEAVKNASAPFNVTVEELYRERPTRFRTGKAGYRFKITLKPDAAAGPFKQEILIKTNDPASPTLTASVEGTIQASLEAQPTKVHFDTLKVGEGAKTLNVLLRGSRPFRILGIDGQGDGVSAAFPERQSPSHIVTVRFQPTQAGALKKPLVIRTDLDGESVTVTVEGSASAP